jgi:hypothetical protein
MKKQLIIYLYFIIFIVLIFGKNFFLDNSIFADTVDKVEIRVIVLPPPPPPPPIIRTRVILQGRAHPLSSVTILKDGRIIGIVTADSLANFRKEIVDITPGIRTFGIWAQDIYERRSLTLSFTTNVRAEMITVINGLFLSPTIDLDRITIPRGETLNILGITAPQSDVSIFINSSPQIIRETQAGDDGVWFYAFNTLPLEEGSYSVRVRATCPEGLQSPFSGALAFTVGEKVPEIIYPQIIYPQADLNEDGRINLIDLSILLFWWGKFDPRVDQNGDKIINLIDFSIMMYWWTG